MPRPEQLPLLGHDRLVEFVGLPEAGRGAERVRLVEAQVQQLPAKHRGARRVRVGRDHGAPHRVGHVGRLLRTGLVAAGPLVAHAVDQQFAHLLIRAVHRVHTLQVRPQHAEAGPGARIVRVAVRRPLRQQGADLLRDPIGLLGRGAPLDHLLEHAVHLQLPPLGVHLDQREAVDLLHQPGHIALLHRLRAQLGQRVGHLAAVDQVQVHAAG